jgi:hypothetical protein
MFYAHTPPAFGKVENVGLADRTISIEDAGRHMITLRASLPLSDLP